MRKVSGFQAIFFFVSIMLAAFCLTRLSEAAPDKDKLDAVDKKFTTTVSNFNGAVEVTVVDKYGKPTKVNILIMPGENVKVPKDMPPQKGRVEWKDVAQYEAMLISINVQDPFMRWYIENLWRDRINRTIIALEEKIRQEYPKDYYKINIRVKDVADALGIDPPVGFLTGETFVKIPDEFGGRVPSVDPSVLEKEIYKPDYIDSKFLKESDTKSASPFN